MSQSALGQKQLTLILLAAAVLLAAIVGVLVWQNMNQPAVPVVDATGGTGAPAGTPPSGMPGGQAPQVEFDPATAPAVPEGQTAVEYVTEYYEACAAKEYDKAFGLLPVASQQYYGDVAAFEQTLESYGISGYAVGEETESGDTVTVVGGQQAQGMTVNYAWAFVRGDDGGLRLMSRTMSQ